MRTLSQTDFLLLFAAILFLAIPAHGVDKKDPKAEAVPAEAAETACESDIFYSWKRAPVPTAPNVPPGSAPPAEPNEAFFRKAIERGAKKDEVEGRVKSRLAQLQTEARTACTRAHENQGLCVADAITLLGANFSSLDFESRRIVREKIVADCAAATGQCLATRASDITCQAAESPEEAAATPAEKKK